MNLKEANLLRLIILCYIISMKTGGGPRTVCPHHYDDATKSQVAKNTGVKFTRHGAQKALLFHGAKA